MVWLEHPRAQYKGEIHQRAILDAGEAPLGDWLNQLTEPVYKKVGRSRKKVVAHKTAGTPTVWREYSERARKNEKEFEKTGIDFNAKASYRCKRLPWAMGVDLTIPWDPKTEADFVNIKRLVMRLMRGETTIAQEFPSYSYGRENWLAESALRDGATDQQDVFTLKGIVGAASKTISIEEMNAAAGKVVLYSHFKSAL